MLVIALAYPKEITAIGWYFAASPLPYPPDPPLVLAGSSGGFDLVLIADVLPDAVLVQGFVQIFEHLVRRSDGPAFPRL